MELFQLEQFKAIVEYGSMLKASEFLYISQSALSQNLRNLENEIGCKLFDRIGIHLILNENGINFFKHVCIILNDIDKLKQSLPTYIPKKSINFVASDEFFFKFFFTDFINLHADKIKFHVNTLNNNDSFKALMTKKADIVIAFENEFDKISNLDLQYKNIKKIHLYSMHMFLSVPFDCSLSTNKSLTLKELTKIPLIRCNTKRGIERWVDHIMKHEKIILNFVGEIDSITMTTLLFSSNSPYNILIPSISVDADERYRTHRKMIPIVDSIAKKDVFIYYYNNDELVVSLVNEFLSNFFLNLKK